MILDFTEIRAVKSEIFVIIFVLKQPSRHIFTYQKYIFSESLSNFLFNEPSTVSQKKYGQEIEQERNIYNALL